MCVCPVLTPSGMPSPVVDVNRCFPNTSGIHRRVRRKIEFAFVGAAVGDEVGNSVGTSVGTAVGSAEGVSVGDAVVGACVGISVGDLVGNAVGVSVGANVGEVVGAPVGEVVGALVGLTECDPVGDPVGAPVAEMVTPVSGSWITPNKSYTFPMPPPPILVGLCAVHTNADPPPNWDTASTNVVSGEDTPNTLSTYTGGTPAAYTVPVVGSMLLPEALLNPPSISSPPSSVDDCVDPYDPP